MATRMFLTLNVNALCFQPETAETSGPELTHCAASFFCLAALVYFERFFYRHILMHDGSHRPNHPDRAVGLKNVPPHIHADSAAFYRMISQLESLHLRSL